MEIISALLLAAGPFGQSDIGYELINPKAIELFERDPRLMRWAVRFFDSNSDGRLSIIEADTAAAEFKRIADGDSDGQVTPYEFRAAREFIVARWKLGRSAERP